MPTKLAIDWDDNELRLVAAQCSGTSVKITDAAVIPIKDSKVADVLARAVSERKLESTDTLVAIGRGQAELRELQLPPVPDDELPDMVRFQATRSFASSGERATVDYLVTRRSDSGVEMIAAAIDPNNLTKIINTCEAAELTTHRIGLRPLAAAALYLTRSGRGETGDTVLIDLLSDDAEIVVARDGKVIFVRTVRMPSGEAARPKALAGELRRSLVACGSSGSLNRVVLWGLTAVHLDDVKMLTEASGCEVDVLDPFEMVDVSAKVREKLPQHLGRLAPLVGLLAADEAHADRLIDFLNPREKAEQKPQHYKYAAMIGAPVAVALLIAFLGYRHLSGLDARIAILEKANAELQPDVDEAMGRIDRTEKIDQVLDANVNWLDEIRRLASSMPASDQMIVRSVSAMGDVRSGGGSLQVFGSVTDPDVINSFEEALRDDAHRVVGDGSTQQKVEGAYNWTARESISIPGGVVRNQRYQALMPANAASEENKESDTSGLKTPETTDSATEEPEAGDSSDATDATDESSDATDESSDATDESSDATDESSDATDESSDATDESGDTTDESGDTTDESGDTTPDIAADDLTEARS